MRPKLLAISLCAFLSAVGLMEPTSRACTRILWNEPGRSVLVGRSMDWFEDIRTNLWVLPRGMQRGGLAAENPLTWRSRYGSLVLTGYDCITADGFNEAGLSVHMLYMQEADGGERDPKVPGLCLSLWTQYYLDNFATVADAVTALESEPYQLIMAVEPNSHQPTTVHLALDDRGGDSAILECIDGKIRVHHDRRFTVMTNEPSFDQQLANLKRYADFGGEAPLPGSSEPADRFVRSAYYVEHLPTPGSEREAVAEMLSVMRNVSVPFGVADPGRPNVSKTLWRTVADLTRGVLYYDAVTSPRIFWIDARNLRFDEGGPILKLDLRADDDLSGEISARFRPSAMFRFLGPS